MRLAFRISLLAIGLASLLGAGAASAGSLVEFPNVSEREPKLLGYLARPTREGPFPAVVVLHGCSGFSSGGSLQLADQLKDWGYVALMVDSLSPRGLTTACGGPVIDQPGDAYAALRYLSQQSFAAPERIAVLGNSMGGYSAYAADRLMVQYFQNFKAVPRRGRLLPKLRSSRDKDDGTDPDPDRRGRRLDPGGTVPRDGGTRPAGRRADANRYHR